VDIPALLEQLQEFPPEGSWQSEPWFSLWSALYHQGDIYSASIAAVPTIVGTLAAQPGRGTLSFYMLPTFIAIADHSEPIASDDDLRHEFMAAISKLGVIAAQEIPTISDKDIQIAARAAVLAANGDYFGAAELLNSDD
jgi:hypothetical protein